MSMNRCATAACLALLCLLTACGPKEDKVAKRRAELKEKFNTEMAQAQEQLAVADSLLQAEEDRYGELKARADMAREQLKADADLLNAVTLSRLRRDSLQTQTELLDGRIRYLQEKLNKLEKGSGNAGERREKPAV